MMQKKLHNSKLERMLYVVLFLPYLKNHLNTKIKMLKV